MAWNSSSAMAMRRRRASAILPGSAKTSCASLDTSRSVRTEGKPTVSCRLPRRSGSSRTSARIPVSMSRSHDGRALEPGFHRDERLGVAFEERDVGAEAADRDVDRQRAASRRRRERLPDERGLAVAARRDQEDLLAGLEIVGSGGRAPFRGRRKPTRARPRRRRKDSSSFTCAWGPTPMRSRSAASRLARAAGAF